MGPAAGLPADPLARARWGGQAQRVSKHPAVTLRQTMAARSRPTIRCRRYCPVNTRALCGCSGRPKSRPCPSTPSTTHGNVLRPLEDLRQSLASSGHTARSAATAKDPPQQRGRLLTRAGYRGRTCRRYCGYGTGTLGRGGGGQRDAAFDGDPGRDLSRVLTGEVRSPDSVFGSECRCSDSAAFVRAGRPLHGDGVGEDDMTLRRLASRPEGKPTRVLRPRCSAICSATTGRRRRRTACHRPRLPRHPHR